MKVFFIDFDDCNVKSRISSDQFCLDMPPVKQRHRYFIRSLYNMVIRQNKTIFCRDEAGSLSPRRNGPGVSGTFIPKKFFKVRILSVRGRRLFDHGLGVNINHGRRAVLSNPRYRIIRIRVIVVSLQRQSRAVAQIRF